MYSVNKRTVKDQTITIIDVKQNNIEATFMDYGATILALQTPDKNGTLATVVMGYDNPSLYLNNGMYLNATIGPTSGRIGNAEFTLNDVTYNLDKNFWKTENLHGGDETLAYQLFDYEIKDSKIETKVIFTFHKQESKSKYPGNQTIQVIYTVTEGELLIEWTGKTDQDTVLNLTNHAYFNLSGNMERTVLGHELFINASNTLALDQNFIPYEVKNIKNTYLDFTRKHPIQDNFFDGIYELPAKGIDDPYMLDNQDFDIVSASLFDEISGRQMDVYTTYPSIVCYTHNFPGDEELLFGRKHEQHLGICFETQNPPNGINLDGIESSILRKEETYKHKTKFVFSVKE